MTLYTHSPLVPPPPTVNRHRRHLYSSSSIRRRFTSVLSFPPISANFSTRPILQCSSSLSMSSQPDSSSVSQPQVVQGSLMKSRAFWVSESIIAWNVDAGNDLCYLFASDTAALLLTADGVSGEDEEDSYGLPENVKEKFPHIKDYRAFRVPSDLDVKPLLKFQLAVATFSSDGRCSDATGLQLAGILDELFSYTGPLGAVYSEEAVSLYL